MIVGHAAFFRYPPGSVVPGKEGRIDSTKALFGKQVFQEPPDSLGGIAVIPVAGADPVADLAGTLFFIKEIGDPD